MVAVILSGCNNFSFSGILDNPPSGPSALQLLPDTINVAVSTGTCQFVAKGGAGGYSFSVAPGGASGPNPTNITSTGLYAAPAASGTDTIIVTDSSNATSESTVMVVNTVPLAISPTTTTADAGGSATFTGSGGTTPYTWSSTGIGSVTPAGLSTATYTVPWNTPGGSAIVRVTDVTSAFREATVTVNAATMVHITPKTTTIDAHGSVTFTANGGSGAYTYGLTGAGSLSTATYTAPWNNPGSATITVTDVNTGGTDTAAVIINAPTALVISPKISSIYANGWVTFTANGGSGNYSYLLVSGPGSVSGSTYTPGVAGPPDGVVRVTDGNTGQTDDATVTVTNVPVGLAIIPPATAVNAGGNVSFSASGGTPPYTFTQFAGGGSFTSPTYIAPWTAGTATIRVTDSASATADATVTINPPPALAITPSATNLNVGQNVTFTGSGGSGTYTWAKISGLGNLVGATYTAPGSATTADIRIRDTLTSQTADAIVTVTAPPQLAIAPASTNVLAGNAVTFTGSGGSGSYSFSLIAGTGTLAGPTYTTVTAETSTVRMTDTITLGTVDATVVSYFPLTLIPDAADVQAGDTYAFDATGGIPPYSYSVTAPGSIDSTGNYTAGSPGTDTVKLTDTIGNSSTATVTVTAVSTWTLKSLDTAARSGQYASLALDMSGNPQIAYYESKNKELRLEKWNGSSWTRQTVDSTGTVGQYASLAIDAGGNARISYYDATNHRLKYAAWNGSSWARQVVDSGGDLGKYTSLCLDVSGNPRISYYDVGNKQLKYAAWNGSSWTKTPVDSGNVGTYTSLALDSSGNPHISYYDAGNKQLKHAFWNGSWNTQTVEASTNVGTFTSIALDGSGHPHISYYDAGNKHLKYASWNGSSWGLPQTVDGASNVGTYTSVRLVPVTGKARIAYYSAGPQDLKYASEN
jgi:hypothetical protein